MNFDQIINNKLNKITSYRELYTYALNGGKFFRSKLAQAIYEHFDGEYENDLHNFIMFLECHQSYTLIHDDLPCMDDAKMRRGHDAHHIYFSPHLSILTGDALINLSYEYLSKITHPANIKIIHMATKMLGANGLILGQIYDLEGLSDILSIYYLKTAKFIQLSLVGAYLLTGNNFRVILDLFKLGKSIGFIFQLLDDLVDVENSITSEQKVNLWYQNSKFATACFHKYYEQMYGIITKYKLQKIDLILTNHFKTVAPTVSKKFNILEKYR